MKPVFQQVFEQGHGDCMAACIASVLELPLGEVPNPNRNGSDYYHREVAAFLRTVGYVPVYFRNPMTPPSSAHQYAEWYECEGLYIIASIPSQKHEGGYHAVVAQLGKPYAWKIVHDPNPNNKPYPADVVPRSFVFLVPLVARPA